MVEIKATHKYPIPLGRTGENEAARIAFTLAPFEEVFPGGTPALLVKRKGDSAAYPVTLTVEGLTAYWTVTSADTDKAGFGQCELQWHLGDTLAKSNKFDFIVVPALEAGTEPPDEPSKRWFDAIQAQIGDLSKLTTKAKDNLVAAINEAARSGGGSGGGTIDMRVSGGYIQYSNDGVTWENLIAVSELKGEAGPQGEQGPAGDNANVTKDAVVSALGFTPIGADDVPVKSVNGATGEVKSTFYVTVTQGSDDNVTADKTAEEVYAAYEAGYAVYAIVPSEELGAAALPLAIAFDDGTDKTMLFATTLFQDVGESPTCLVVFCISGAWLTQSMQLAKKAEIPTIPTALKNPNALNIKIGDTTTSYDGSAAKTVEIPKGVPAVTDTDNGKILRVVNGAWAAAELLSAGGVSF